MQKSKKFWAYDFSQQQEIKNELLENAKLKGRFFDDLSSLYYEFLASPPHPALKQPYGKEHTEPNVITFLNVLIDINTLKLLFHVIPNSKVITLKLSSNLLEFANFEFLINSILNKPNNIYNLIYEWNSEFRYEGKTLSINRNHQSYINPANALLSPKQNVKDPSNNSDLVEVIAKYEEYLIKLSTSPKIEALCLRGNFMGDENAKLLFENLKNNSCLKVLSLYKNSLTSQCIPPLCDMLEVNKKLEELNLGGNSLNDQDLSMIKNSIGKIQLTAEEIESYLKRAKEREAIIEKNKKLKAAKKPEEPVPIIEEVVQQGEQYFLMKNTKLKVLNLMQNNFSEQCFETVIAMLDLNQDLLLTIDNKIFSKNLRDKLNHPHSKYSNRIYLAK